MTLALVRQCERDGSTYAGDYSAHVCGGARFRAVACGGEVVFVMEIYCLVLARYLQSEKRVLRFGGCSSKKDPRSKKSSVYEPGTHVISKQGK